MSKKKQEIKEPSFNKLYKNDNHSKSTEPEPVQTQNKQEMREYYKLLKNKKPKHKQTHQAKNQDERFYYT